MFNPLSKLNKLRAGSSVTDLLVGLMVGLFVLIILYVSILQDYIQNNLTGTTQTMANIAVWFMFIAVALTAIYSAIKRAK
jgi:divalent metal cation (Fe/Co/Zn/Cd) transporter